MSVAFFSVRSGLFAGFPFVARERRASREAERAEK